MVDEIENVILKQSSYAPWKSWKTLDFYVYPWKTLENWETYKGVRALLKGYGSENLIHLIWKRFKNNV